jgi:NADH dehydrogenase
VKIVVAGGTGFLGRHISKALLDGGHEVTVLGRNPDRVSSIPELNGANATRGDVTLPETLTGTLEGADAIVGAVQFPNHPVEVPRKGLTYANYDFNGTQHLLAEAQRSGVTKYVYLSGAGANTASDKTWYRAKGFAEQAVKGSGLDHAIVRPSWAYGPEDKALNRLAQIARFSPVLPRLGWREQRVQPVSSEDIALTFRRIFERDEAWGKTFEIGGPPMTMEEILHTLLDVIGKKRPVLPVPTPLLKLGTSPLKLLPSPPMTPQGIEFAVQDGLVDTTLAQEVLGVHPVGLREGLSRYLN